MRAMCLSPDSPDLFLCDVPVPSIGDGDLLIRIEACGVCRTDLHILDGDLVAPRYPVIPGHEIVGRVERIGRAVRGFSVGDYVGVPWVGGTCGACVFCRTGRENLCDNIVCTGFHRSGGFADYTAADHRFVFHLPESLPATEAAPLLCAGLIGYRALRAAGDRRRIGIYGFGAAAHLIAQVAVGQDREIYAFTRPGDAEGQRFARSLGCRWAGGSDETPPVLLEAALIFAPVGSLVVTALAHLEKGGIVVAAGIHMSDIPAFPYRLLWGERSVVSVANLTRNDGISFFDVLTHIAVKASVTTFRLTDANEAIEALRTGRLHGAAVLVP